MLDFVFFGTDEFAVRVLEELKARLLIPTLIITTPDTPKGRKLIPSPPPVKIWAKENSIELAQPENLSEFASILKLKPYTLFLVASYGKIIPKEILAIPKHGTLNIHPSILPKYRGPSPIQTAILNGDKETGVSIIILDEKMDHGPILATAGYKLPTINFVKLRDELAQLGSEILIQILPDYLSGKIKPVAQNHPQATFTKKIAKEDGSLNLQDPPELNERKIRALNPNPGTYIIDQGKRIKILSAHIANEKLVPERVIPEGKKEMDWGSYLRGRKPSQT